MSVMRQNKKYLFSIVLIAVGMVVFGQENKELDTSFLNEVYKTYNIANSYQMEVEVAMIDKENNLVYPKQKNVTLKSDDNFYIETQELTSIQTSEYQLLIDHISKEVRYTTLSTEQIEKYKKSKKTSNIPDFSALENEVLDIHESGALTMVNFKENLQFKKTTYAFNTVSKLLEQVDYYSEGSEYGQPAHIKIVYTTTNFNKAVNTSVFYLGNYVQYQEEKLVLNEVYKAYSLINNTVTQ